MSERLERLREADATRREALEFVRRPEHQATIERVDANAARKIRQGYDSEFTLVRLIKLVTAIEEAA